MIISGLHSLFGVIALLIISLHMCFSDRGLPKQVSHTKKTFNFIMVCTDDISILKEDENNNTLISKRFFNQETKV